jgi:hypothetical protein
MLLVKEKEMKMKEALIVLNHQHFFRSIFISNSIIFMYECVNAVLKSVVALFAKSLFLRFFLICYLHKTHLLSILFQSVLKNLAETSVYHRRSFTTEHASGKIILLKRKYFSNVFI